MTNLLLKLPSEIYRKIYSYLYHEVKEELIIQTWRLKESLESSRRVRKRLISNPNIYSTNRLCIWIIAEYEEYNTQEYKLKKYKLKDRKKMRNKKIKHYLNDLNIVLEKILKIDLIEIYNRMTKKCIPLEIYRKIYQYLWKDVQNDLMDIFRYYGAPYNKDKRELLYLIQIRKFRFSTNFYEFFKNLIYESIITKSKNPIRSSIEKPKFNGIVVIFLKTCLKTEFKGEDSCGLTRFEHDDYIFIFCNHNYQEIICQGYLFYLEGKKLFVRKRHFPILGTRIIFQYYQGVEFFYVENSSINIEKNLLSSPKNKK